MNFKNTTVLITGGSSGIGLAMAKQMDGMGARVIICGRDLQKLDFAKSQTPTLTTLVCDVSKREQRRQLYDRISRDFPTLNMVINNAAYADRFIFKGATNLEERISQEWQTNYLAPMMLAELFLPMLIKNRGNLVNITSGLVHVPLYIEPNYCATKAALHSMTRSLRIQLAQEPLRVTEVLFPAVKTPFNQGHAPSIAIEPEEAAYFALKGIARGKEEIHVKMAGMLYRMSRLFPRLIHRKMNGIITMEMAQAIAS